jgi:hypothetical protein
MRGQRRFLRRRENDRRHTLETEGGIQAMSDAYTHLPERPLPAMTGGNPAVRSPLSPLAVPLLLKPGLGDREKPEKSGSVN